MEQERSVWAGAPVRGTKAQGVEGWLGKEAFIPCQEMISALADPVPSNPPLCSPLFYLPFPSP